MPIVRTAYGLILGKTRAKIAGVRRIPHMSAAQDRGMGGVREKEIPSATILDDPAVINKPGNRKKRLDGTIHIMARRKGAVGFPLRVADGSKFSDRSIQDNG